ncbi:MAG: META domain-containing protein [Caldilinea sp.]
MDGRETQKRGVASFPMLLLVVLLALAVTGCRSVARNDPAAQATATAEAKAAVEASLLLAGTAWDVAYFFEPEQQVAVAPGTRLTTNFLVDRYAGSGGCNWYLGVYAAGESVLRFYAPAETLIICADEAVNEQEALFHSTMANTIEYEIDGEQLIAYTSDRQRLITYDRAAPIPFEGTQWSLKFISTGEDVLPQIPFTEVTAIFDGARVSGSGGCNEYAAVYTLNGKSMTIGVPEAAAAQCSEPDGIMEQEALFLATLPRVATFEQVGGMLLLIDGENTPVMLLGAP